MKRHFRLTAAFLALLAGPTWAGEQSYSVSLAGRQLGTLTFNGHSRNAAFLLALDNAPFGIKNGTFSAVTQAQGDQVSYLGTNRGSETRDIDITRSAGQVTSVAVAPPSERTEISEAAKVPAGVIFPPELFAALATAETCPAPLAAYDGRRVVQIAPEAVQREGDRERCDMSYRVVMGPGYVAPFYLKSFGMELVYTARTLARASISGGGFTVHLNRQ
ncbi:hypothetical protein [Sulfitobacter sp. PS-8MA]|uniref:hypothetical protein n=1 Tax=Sulfitobacter sp. PS-8MA TaxID=3237707 RepID=UPI0034C5CE6D